MDFLDPALLHVLPGYLILGALAGFCAGLLGIGGGTILVPGLFFLLKNFGEGIHDEDILMHTVLATSMAIIMPTGISSSWAQIKRKAVDWDAVKLMAPGLVLGSIAGVVLVSHLNSAILQLIFSIGLYGIVISLITKKEIEHSYPILKKSVCAVPSSFVFGIASALLGIGGAVLNVPYLNRAGWPLKTVIASASVLGVILSFPAIVSYILTGEGVTGFIDVTAIIMIVPVSVLIAPLGVRVSHALPVAKLKLMFAVFLILVATKMLFELI